MAELLNFFEVKHFHFFFFGVLKVESNSVVVMNGKMEGEEGRKCIYMETGPLKIRRSRLFHSGEE